MIRAVKDNSRFSNEDREREKFYEKLVACGDLVFDVGANVGNRTRVFRHLGCRVVAVEPQNWPRSVLERSFKHDENVIISKFALGQAAGTKKMLIFGSHTLSTLTETWVRRTRASGRFSDFQWTSGQSVDVVTLDSMVETYGQPSFIKIDVEGYELEVLRGLSFSVDALSFEFTPEMSEKTGACLDHLIEIGMDNFQLVLDTNVSFEFDTWTSIDALRARLQELRGLASGDIYARSSAPFFRTND